MRYGFKVGGVVPAASQFFFGGTDVGGVVPAASQFFGCTDLKLERLSLLLPNLFWRYRCWRGCPRCFQFFLGTDLKLEGLSLLPPFFWKYGFKVGGVVPAASQFFLEVQMLEGLSLLLPNCLAVRI